MEKQKTTNAAFSGDIPTPDGFDIVYETIVGHVSYLSDEKLNPMQAAFLVIEGTQKDGTYRFPGPHADTDVVVTVEGMEYREGWDGAQQ